MTIDHDQQHMDVVDSYLRDILLFNPEDDDAIDAIEIVPDDIWPCVLSAMHTLLQSTLGVLAEIADRTYEKEVDLWLTPEKES